MNPNIQIEATNLAYLWYGKPDAAQEEYVKIVDKYLKEFLDPDDKNDFLTETLRITKDVMNRPDDDLNRTASFRLWEQAIASRLSRQ